ncbi:MAG: hypothetical protein II325_04035, partial [Clostridia bacterium]|nr:hypothetical protein [Clostridia bacterium]
MNQKQFLLCHFPSIDKFSALVPDGAPPEGTQGADEEAPAAWSAWLVDGEYQGEYQSTKRYGALVADTYQLQLENGQVLKFSVERSTGRVIEGYIPHEHRPYPTTKEQAACEALELLRDTCGETFSLELVPRTWNSSSQRLTFALPIEDGEVTVAKFTFWSDCTQFSVSPFASELIALLPETEALHTSVLAKLKEVYKGGLEMGSFTVKDFALTYQSWYMTEEGAQFVMDVAVTLVTTPGGPVYPSQKGYDAAYSKASRIPEAPTQAEWDSASEKTEKLTVCVTVKKDQRREAEPLRALIRRKLYDTYFLYDYWPTGWRRQLPEECPSLLASSASYESLGMHYTDTLPEEIVREITVMDETFLMKATVAQCYPGAERLLSFNKTSTLGETPEATMRIGEDTGLLMKFDRVKNVVEEGDFRPEDAVKAAEELWGSSLLLWEVTEEEDGYRLKGYAAANPSIFLGDAQFSKSGVLNYFSRNEYANQALSTAAPTAQEIQQIIEARIAEYYRPYYDAGMVSPQPTVTWVYGNHGYDHGYIRMLEDGRLGFEIKATIEHVTPEGTVEDDIM